MALLAFLPPMHQCSPVSAAPGLVRHGLPLLLLLLLLLLLCSRVCCTPHLQPLQPSMASQDSCPGRHQDCPAHALEQLACMAASLACSLVDSMTSQEHDNTAHRIRASLRQQTLEHPGAVGQPAHRPWSHRVEACSAGKKGLHTCKTKVSLVSAKKCSKSSTFPRLLAWVGRMYLGQNAAGQDTTALKVPGRSLSRVLVEPNPV